MKILMTIMMVVLTAYPAMAEQLFDVEKEIAKDKARIEGMIKEGKITPYFDMDLYVALRRNSYNELNREWREMLIQQARENIQWMHDEEVYRQHQETMSALRELGYATDRLRRGMQ